MEASEFEKRMDRFEVKIDKLSEAVFAIVRVEERQAQHASSMNRMFTAVEKMERRVLTLENVVTTNTIKVGFGERVWWVVATAGVGFIAWFAKNGG